MLWAANQPELYYVGSTWVPQCSLHQTRIRQARPEGRTPRRPHVQAEAQADEVLVKGLRRPSRREECCRPGVILARSTPHFHTHVPGDVD